MSAWIMPPRAAGMKTSHGVDRKSPGLTDSAPSNSATEPPSSTCRARASASIPPSSRMAPWASEAATIFAPSFCMIRAAQEPTLP